MLQEIEKLYKDKEFQKCHDLCLEKLKTERNNFDIITYKGLCELRLKNFNESIKTFNHCLAINDKWFHIWTFRGDAFYELEEYKKAFSDYWYSLQLEPDNSAVMDKCARSLFRIGEYEYALEYISKAVEKAESPEPFIIMAAMLETMGKAEEAQKIKQRVKEQFG